MRNAIAIKVNFRGGIVSPGELLDILNLLSEENLLFVRFGLRQQLYIDVTEYELSNISKGLKDLNIFFEINEDEHPNIISSYPAEEIFISNTWLSEGIYKDILDEMTHKPKLKINISDCNQSFTPMLTGNINWVASKSTANYWHLFIRFPKTNVIYEWAEMVYTNDIATLSKEIEAVIFTKKELFYDKKNANGNLLFSHINTEKYITKKAEAPARLPQFNLPYYEGLNSYNNKLWLGIYRRDELFSIAFLKDLCHICLETKIGQLCATSWKTIIVKGIEQKDRDKWSVVLDKHEINMRHAANELNFQVEDNSYKGLQLKKDIVKYLNNMDTRSFGICIGIKTSRKSEVFSSILIKRKPLIHIGRIQLFFVYDILCAHNFNPNKRTGFVFSKNNPKIFLQEELRRTITYYYHKNSNILPPDHLFIDEHISTPKNEEKTYVHQCRNCFTIYDPLVGEPESNIPSGTFFEALPNNYICAVCESVKEDFVKVEKNIQSSLQC